MQGADLRKALKGRNSIAGDNVPGELNEKLPTLKGSNSCELGPLQGRELPMPSRRRCLRLLNLVLSGQRWLASDL